VLSFGFLIIQRRVIMPDLAMPMLTRATRCWFVASPLEPHADCYVQYLRDLGYAPGSIRSYLVTVAHFAHWLSLNGFDLVDVDEARVYKFIDRHVPACRCAVRLPRLRHYVRPALLHLLVVLRAGRLISPRIPTDPPGIVHDLCAFERHLAEVRGLAPVTCYARVVRVRAFLLDRFGSRKIQLSTLRRSDVIGFMARYTADWKPSSKQGMASALRSYFRFKAIAGESTTIVTAAIPRIAQWRLAPLPKSLSPSEIVRLLRAFDRTCATGKRDYAIARCFADLGLRTVEIARLELDDVDWQAGTLRIRGKWRRIDTLPLPTATGQALVAYLRDGRPKSGSRSLFLRHRPPVGMPATPCIVRNAVRFAARRCGLEARVGGPHVLRHSVATQLVRGGATLKEVADVLRHRSVDTTTIYAKVDIPTLSRVAMPWPGSRP
jgi:integrase/recombinase XerD